MAKAVSNIKRVRVEGDITLTLSPEEAIYLKALLAITVELDKDLDIVVGNYKTAEKYSVGLWDALDVAGVPSAERVFDDDEVQVASNSLNIIERAVGRF